MAGKAGTKYTYQNPTGKAGKRFWNSHWHWMITSFIMSVPHTMVIKQNFWMYMYKSWAGQKCSLYSNIFKSPNLWSYC